MAVAVAVKKTQGVVAVAVEGRHYQHLNQQQWEQTAAAAGVESEVVAAA